MTRVLNGGVASSVGTGARRKPDELSSELQKSMLRMKGEFMDADGKGVDYDGLRKSALFSDYVELSRDLVECDMKCLGAEERKAFFISILVLSLLGGRRHCWTHTQTGFSLGTSYTCRNRIRNSPSVLCACMVARL